MIDSMGRVVRVVPVGVMLSFSRPEAQVDPFSRLNLLYQDRPQSYSYQVFDPDGELLKEWAGEDAAIRKLFADSEWMEITGEEPATVDTEPQIDRAAELLEKWQVKTGELWQIGEHRLICGDCTDKAVVERVMGREKAAITFTSPP